MSTSCKLPRHPGARDKLFCSIEINGNPWRLDLAWRWHRRHSSLACSTRFVADSPLEGAGFEPSDPRRRRRPFRGTPAPGATGILSRHVCGYCQPLSLPPSPDIGIASIPLLALCGGVAGARVNDRDFSKNADLYLLRREATNRHRSGDLCQELGLVDERPMGSSTENPRPRSRRTATHRSAAPNGCSRGINPSRSLCAATVVFMDPP